MKLVPALTRLSAKFRDGRGSGMLDHRKAAMEIECGYPPANRARRDLDDFCNFGDGEETRHAIRACTDPALSGCAFRR